MVDHIMKDLIGNRFLVIVVEVSGGHKFAVLDVKTNNILEAYVMRSDAIESCIAREQELLPQR